MNIIYIHLVILYMKDGCQDIYQHRVLKDNNMFDKDRISLVFKKHK